MLNYFSKEQKEKRKEQRQLRKKKKQLRREQKELESKILRISWIALIGLEGSLLILFLTLSRFEAESFENRLSQYWPVFLAPLALWVIVFVFAKEIAKEKIKGNMKLIRRLEGDEI